MHHVMGRLIGWLPRVLMSFETHSKTYKRIPPYFKRLGRAGKFAGNFQLVHRKFFLIEF